MRKLYILFFLTCLSSGVPVQAAVIHDAASSGDIPALKEFLSKGTDINARNTENFTALHLAVRKNHIEAVKLLIEKGADVNAEGGLLFFSHGMPLHFAAYGGNLQMVKLLVENGAYVKATANGLTALHLAAQEGYLDMSGYLIDHGAEVNAEVSGGLVSYGSAPLHVAAAKGHLAVVKLLVEKGADTTIKDSNGDTPLEVAVMKKHQEIVDYLRARTIAPRLSEKKIRDLAFKILGGDPYGETPDETSRLIVSATFSPHGSDQCGGIHVPVWVLHIVVPASPKTDDRIIDGYLLIGDSDGKARCAGLPYADSFLWE